MHSLLVIAHPDDEVLYFGGLLLGAGLKTWPATRNMQVILVTDANADGNGKKRLQQFHRTMKELKIKNFLTLNFPDRFESRLDTDTLTQALIKITALSPPALVFTHGIVGEYGHPHHQDVSFSVHSAFKKHPQVWSVAQHAYPEKTLELTTTQFNKKGLILSKTYGSETVRFQNIIPNTAHETFHRVPYSDIEIIYKYLIGKRKILPLLKKYKTYIPYLKSIGSGKKIPRLF